MYSKSLITSKIFVDVADRRRKAVLIKMIFSPDTRKMAAITTNYFSSKMCKFHYSEFSFSPNCLLSEPANGRKTQLKVFFLKQSGRFGEVFQLLNDG